MVNAASINAPQGAVLSIQTQKAASLNAPQLNALGIYNVPAKKINVAQASETVIYRRIAQEVNVTQMSSMAVIAGRIGNPKLAAWGFTLDGHDFIVLKLGTFQKTFVFDISTGQWSWWSSGSSVCWSPNVGMNWRSSGMLPKTYGSNVIVGDDTTGMLYILDPLYGLDDGPIVGTVGTFPRTATGQMTTRDRNFLQIFSLNLTASIGNPALTGQQVTLEYSDDQGHTFVTADDPITTTAGDYTTDFVWYSLGLVRSPGRLYRIQDDGACQRIDSLDVNI